MNHRIQCQCGALSGEISNTRSAIRAVCYCKDCRAYAFHLGRPHAILDEIGGTDVVATQSRHVALTGGIEHLACLSLSDKGLLRWYAKCCNTPIANTPRNWRIPYVGLVHSGLKKPLESSFARVQMHVNTKSAKGRPPSTRRSQTTTLLGFLPAMLFARVAGTYQHTPFCSPSGVPIVEVHVLTGIEREKAQSAA